MGESVEIGLYFSSFLNANSFVKHNLEILASKAWEIRGLLGKERHQYCVKRDTEKTLQFYLLG